MRVYKQAEINKLEMYFLNNYSENLSFNTVGFVYNKSASAHQHNGFYRLYATQ